MSFAAKNQTNPLIVDVTGYAPYRESREKRTESTTTEQLKQNRRAQATREYWNRQKVLDQLTDYTKEHDVNLFRNQWECEADKKALYSRVRWEMDKITAEMEKELEQRRNRLSDLLKSEECQYFDEMRTVQEDPEAKQDRMMQRYAELKALRESEREQTAEEKKEQQFKRNCEELRTLVSQKLKKMTVEDSRKITKEKEQEALERDLEDKMYAELWARDRQTKDLKDAREEEERRRKNMETGRFVRDQILKNQLEKQKKQREKEHELTIMQERARLATLEEQYEKELKKKKQSELKTGLDQCTREKLKRRAKEVQDDLMVDLFFMSQIAESEEEATRCEKKRALMNEQQQYLKYLKDKIQAEADFERQVDRMYAEELDKIWKKREQEWDREKKRRRELESDVLKEVQEQITSNLEKSRRVQALNQDYSRKIVDADEEDRKRAIEKLRLIRGKNEANQRDLLEQIRKKEEELEEQKRKRDLELELVRREREEQEKKIQKLLEDVKIDNEHPFRCLGREMC